MEKEFIPYEQALALKELGFDEPCMAGYDISTNQLFIGYEHNHDFYTQAPLYQQAFRWFRENHNLYAEVKVEDSVKLGGQKFYWIVFGACKSFEGSLWIRCLEDSNGVMSNTYEEAELECLKKLIEICKN
jgi:hypothetical protein